MAPPEQIRILSVEDHPVFRYGLATLLASEPDMVLDALVAHTWPGNIRELQNFVERAVIRSAGDELRPTRGGTRGCRR